MVKYLTWSDKARTERSRSRIVACWEVSVTVQTIFETTLHLDSSLLPYANCPGLTGLLTTLSVIPA